MRTKTGSGWLARQRTLPSALTVFFLIGTQVGCSAEDSSQGWDHLKQEIRSKYPTVPMITAEELGEWLDRGDQPLLLLDARSQEEFQVSHLQGAKSASSLQEALKTVERFGKNRQIVVYCSVGYRSAALAEALQERGFKPTYNLEGSIFEWANQGRAVFREGRQVNGVHPYDPQWGRYLNRNLWNWGESGR